LVFVVVVGDDVGFATASSSSFIEELLLEAFFFDLGACLRLFRFLLLFANDERSSSTMFFSEEPSTLFLVHSSSSSSSVVPSSRVAFISIHPRTNPLVLSLFVNSACGIINRMGFLLKRRENVKTTNHFFLLPPRRRNEKAFSNDALSQRTLLLVFSLSSRVALCEEENERVFSPFLFALLRSVCFFFFAVCGDGFFV
jgi:hypothetical protein